MVTMKGKIFSGLGQGGFFTQLDWVKQQCQEKLNFVPFPGTLNIKLDGQYSDTVKEIKEKQGVTLVPPTADFCPARCYPVFIGSVRAAIVVPEAEHFTDEVHPQDVIEIIAPVNIKGALSVKDGDELTLQVEEQ